MNKQKAIHYWFIITLSTTAVLIIVGSIISTQKITMLHELKKKCAALVIKHETYKKNIHNLETLIKEQQDNQERLSSIGQQENHIHLLEIIQEIINQSKISQCAVHTITCQKYSIMATIEGSSMKKLLLVTQKLGSHPYIKNCTPEQFTNDASTNRIRLILQITILPNQLESTKNN